MHADLFDRYQARASLVHALDPRAKVVVTILFILSNALLPDGAWLAFLLSWGLILGVSGLAGLGAGYVVRRSFVALPFVLAAISAVFAVPGRAVAAFDLGPWHLVATDAGLVRFASIVVRSWLSVQMAILLTATTDFPDLIHALRHLRVPQVLVSVIAFMYRYLFVLADESMRLMRAREARSARLPGGGGGSPGWRARVAGHMAGQLFLRSYERSDRIYAAMLARGYTGQLLTLNQHELHPRDWVVVILAVFVILLLQVFSRL
jgi:cobalt/nickel transport system permease protein